MPASGACCEGDTLSVRFHFARGESAVDTSFADNGAALRRVSGIFGADDSIAGVMLRGSASPEGSLPFNIRLSDARVQSLAALCRDISPRVADRGIDWTMLAGMIDGSDEEWRADALQMIRDTDPEGSDSGALQCIGRLKCLRGGNAWRYMLDRFFPAMRYAECRIAVVPPAPVVPGTPEADMMTAAEPPAAASADTVSGSTAAAYAAAPGASAGRRSGVRFALKTNLLYDAILIPDLGAEVELAGKYSASARWMYAWWSKSSRHRFWRIYGGELELRRWWPSAATLTGHHAGIYTQMLTYDIELGRTGYMGRRWTHSIGLSYGYSKALSRCFNIDFTIGIGYLWGKYKKYHREDDCYVWSATKNRRWLGPTKAEISLVYIIGGNAAGKGGAR